MTYAYNDGGQTISMIDTGSFGNTTSYSYDSLNRLIQVINGNGIVKYRYDEDNRRTYLDFGPRGSCIPPICVLNEINYSYDGLSRPLTLSTYLVSSNSAASLSYIYNGSRLSQMIYPNGITATYSLDGAGRLTSLSHIKGGAAPVFSATYTLDPLGNRTAISENLNGVNCTLAYRYDEMSRLVSDTLQVGINQPVTSTYQYDGVGNRTQFNTYLPPNTKGGTNPLVMTTTYSYNQADWLTSRSETGSATPFNGYTYNYSYDFNGSLISETNTAPGGEVTAYSWDARNRLSQVQKQAKGAALSTAIFTYDGANNRMGMNYGSGSGNNNWTYYLVDPTAPNPVVLQENKVPSQPTSYFYPLDSTTPYLQGDNNGNWMWYHSDGLGSVRALTTNSGVITGTNSYSAFGLNAGQTGKTTNDHLFAGEQLDPTGLYFNRARYYNPSLGRFIGRDVEAGDPNAPLSQNRYTYASNNPALLTDPSGFSAQGPSVPTPAQPAPPNPSPGLTSPIHLSFCLTIGGGEIGVGISVGLGAESDTKTKPPSILVVVIRVLIVLIAVLIAIITGGGSGQKQDKDKKGCKKDCETFRKSAEENGLTAPPFGDPTSSAYKYQVKVTNNQLEYNVTGWIQPPVFPFATDSKYQFFTDGLDCSRCAMLEAKLYRKKKSPDDPGSPYDTEKGIADLKRQMEAYRNIINNPDSPFKEVRYYTNSRDFRDRLRQYLGEVFQTPMGTKWRCDLYTG